MLPTGERFETWATVRILRSAKWWGMRTSLAVSSCQLLDLNSLQKDVEPVLAFAWTEQDLRLKACQRWLSEGIWEGSVKDATLFRLTDQLFNGSFWRDEAEKRAE